MRNPKPCTGSFLIERWTLGLLFRSTRDFEPLTIGAHSRILQPRHLQLDNNSEMLNKVYILKDCFFFRRSQNGGIICWNYYNFHECCSFVFIVPCILILIIFQPASKNATCAIYLTLLIYIWSQTTDSKPIWIRSVRCSQTGVMLINFHFTGFKLFYRRYPDVSFTFAL